MVGVSDCELDPEKLEEIESENECETEEIFEAEYVMLLDSVSDEDHEAVSDEDGVGVFEYVTDPDGETVPEGDADALGDFVTEKLFVFVVEQESVKEEDSDCDREYESVTDGDQEAVMLPVTVGEKELLPDMDGVPEREAVPDIDEEPLTDDDQLSDKEKLPELLNDCENDGETDDDGVPRVADGDSVGERLSLRE
jgi:hypothetical protein